MLHREKEPFCRKRLFLSIDKGVFRRGRRYNAASFDPNLRISRAEFRRVEWIEAAVHARSGRLRTAHNAMKLHSTPTQHYQTVTAYDDAGVEINAVRFTYSLVVMPENPPVAWAPPSFDALAAEHFSQIEAAAPDVVILGTGHRQRFVHPRLTAALTARRIGVECMDNQAACRTYNILMSEGRKVALALIFETAAQNPKP
jgi:uncharacterized protein